MYQPTLPGSSYEHFVTAVQQFPLLSHEEEIRHARALRDTGDLDAAHALVTSHLRLVVSMARQYAGYGLPPADMVQEGTIGLMKAVKKYDPEQGIRLTTYALPHIKYEITDYVVKQGRSLKIASTKAQRKLFFNLRRMKSGTSLSAAEAAHIAVVLDVSVDDVREMDTRLSGRDVSFDVTVDEEDGFSIGDTMEAEGCDPVDILCGNEYDALKLSLTPALNRLDERSRDVLMSRKMSDIPATFKELSIKYGVSIERIRQIEAKAIESLRAMMQ